jgi:hypothetical protein
VTIKDLKRKMLKRLTKPRPLDIVALPKGFVVYTGNCMEAVLKLKEKV